jgi:hypothetical protein
MSSIQGELWYKVTCPDDECGAINFIYAGYFLDSDSSKMDVDGFVCWKCDREFGFPEDEEPFTVEDGQEHPGYEN